MRNLKFLIGASILGLYGLAAVIGPAILKFSPYEANLERALIKPSWAHPLGTDALGRDLLVRVLYGARYSLILSLGAMALIACVSLLLGIVASYYKGTWLEHLMMGSIDVITAIPVVIMAIIVVSIVPLKILGLLLALIFVYTPTMTRLARSKALSVKEASYVEAAVALGATVTRILARHVLPNVLIPVVADSILRVGEAIILIAALSYVGLGVDPPTPEWGVLLRHAMEYMTVAPYILFGTGGALAVLILGLNVLGDSLMGAKRYR